jgi:uncharacterized iron-regulated protein
MEMFQQNFQQAVDDYLEGGIDEVAFLQKTEYFNTWGYDYNLYKPIIQYLKQQRIPLVALNIQSQITRKVARKGLDSLTDEERKQLPSAMDFSNEKYRIDLRSVFNSHLKQQDIQDFNYFLQAQTLWDEIMAETAQQFLKNNPEFKLVILAGNGHIRWKYGIPDRLYRRNRAPFTVIVQDEKAEYGIADYVLMTQKLNGRGSPLLGITLEEKDPGLLVRGVSHNSPAEKAEIRKGDLIEQFNGKPIKKLADLRIALYFSETGRSYKIQIKRDDRTLHKEIELFSF